MSLIIRIFTAIWVMHAYVGNTAASELYWLSEPSVDVGLLPDNEAEQVKVSTNSRYISFVSRANNLVLDDFNHIEDLFIRDTQTGITELVSVTASGAQASTEGITRFSKPSSDGRYVAFVSVAPEYPGGNGDDHQLFVKDLVTGVLSNESNFGSGDLFTVNSGHVYLHDDGLSVIFSTNGEIDPLHVGTFSTQVYLKDLTDDSYTLLSTSLSGTEVADDNTYLEHVSGSGRYLLLKSRADNLSAAVINNSGENLFSLDRVDDSRSLVNVTPSGDSSSDTSFTGFQGQISNQETVAFTSNQDDLVANDNNNRLDVFWFDNGLVTRINVDALGNEMTGTNNFNDVAISGDGNRVVFTEYSDELFPADVNQSYDMYSYATATGAISLVSQNELGLKVNDHSYEPQFGFLSDLLIFRSVASDYNNEPVYGKNMSIYLHDFNTGDVTQQHVAAFPPETLMDDAIHVKTSTDLNSIVFSSLSPNLVPEPIAETVDLFLLDRSTNAMSRIASNIISSEHDISPSGRYITFRTQHLPPDGISPIGSVLIYRYDLQTDTFLAIEAGQESLVSDLGAVAFTTFDDLSVNDTNGQLDVYVYNPNNGNVVLVSEDLNGDAAGAADFDLGGTGNEVLVVYTSDNDNIVANDNNGQADVFLKQFGTATGTILITATSDGTQANDQSFAPAISDDGQWVAFITEADNLTTDNYTDAHVAQVLLYDRQSQEHTLVSLNEHGTPLTSAGTSSITSIAVSNTGRYLTYVFSDAQANGDDNVIAGVITPEFANDTDGNKDVVLVDTANLNRAIISKLINGQETVDEAKDGIQIRSNLTSTSPEVGVVFIADHGTLTGRTGHPGHREVHLYQQPIWAADAIFLDDFE